MKTPKLTVTAIAKPDPLGLAGFEAFTIRVIGSGKRSRIQASAHKIRTTGHTYGIGYGKSFPTAENGEENFKIWLEDMISNRGFKIAKLTPHPNTEYSNTVSFPAQ